MLLNERSMILHHPLQAGRQTWYDWAEILLDVPPSHQRAYKTQHSFPSVTLLSRSEQVSVCVCMRASIVHQQAACQCRRHSAVLANICRGHVTAKATQELSGRTDHKVTWAPCKQASRWGALVLMLEEAHSSRPSAYWTKAIMRFARSSKAARLLSIKTFATFAYMLPRS